jgi:hypothetical protein
MSRTKIQSAPGGCWCRPARQAGGVTSAWIAACQSGEGRVTSEARDVPQMGGLRARPGALRTCRITSVNHARVLCTVMHTFSRFARPYQRSCAAFRCSDRKSDRLFVLSRSAGMFWMSCQIFQLCASRLAGATAPVRRAGRLAGQDGHAYCGCLDHQAAADPARRRPGGQNRGLLRGRSPRAAGDPAAGRLGSGHQCDASGVVPDHAALRRWHPVAAARS